MHGQFPAQIELHGGFDLVPAQTAAEEVIELRDGGLGGAVAELLAEKCPVPVLRHGVNDEFGRSGKAGEVLAYYGLTPEKLAEKARAAIAMKK